MRISRKKTEYLMFTGNMNSDVNSNINLQGENLYRVTSFAYLVSTLAMDGDLDVDMTSRV